MFKRTLAITFIAIIAVTGIVGSANAVTSLITGNNNLRLYGTAFNPAGFFTIDDNTLVNGKLTVKGNVSDSSGKLTITDDVAVSGDVIVEGGAEVKGEIYNSNDVVTINDDVYVAGLLAINSMETPTTASCATDGGLSYDANYLYLCVSGTWKKVALQDL